MSVLLLLIDGLAEHDLSVEHVDHLRHAGLDGAGDDLAAQFVQQFLLDHALDWARAELRVVAGVYDVGDQLGARDQVDVLLGELVG